MIKMSNQDQLKMHSPNLVDSNIEKISALFPNCVTEAQGENGELKKAIDFDLLKQELSQVLVEGEQERYRLDWVGKKEAILTANAPIAKTLRPCREESVNFDSTENLFIEGDNLEALKLLQENYLGKVKMIYIDPPYNTGNDFIYEDDFAESTDAFFEKSNQVDEEGNRLIANTDSNGRFHSDWLSMMYSRLKLARNLLKEDGVIFISCDDSEIDNLKKISDEVFGADNFINNISLNLKNVAGASGGGEDKRLKKNIEYILVFAKNYLEIENFNGVYNYSPIGELVKQYEDEGRSWKYTSVLTNFGEKIFVCTTIDGEGNDIKIFKRNNYEIKSINQLIRDENLTEQEAYNKYGRLIFQTQMPQSSIRPRVMEKVLEIGIESDLYSIEYVPRSGRNKGKMYEQFYKGGNFRLLAWLKDVAEEINGQLYKKDMQGTYWDFVNATKNLSKEGSVPFQNGKKPVSLIKRMIEMVNGNDYLVLDFFAGSSSTAHAVLEANLLDQGTRKYIMVQLPEELNEKLEAQKEGFQFCKNNQLIPTVAEISKERIRRAGKKIVEDNADKEGIENLDIGFRVLKIDSTNMKDVYYTPNALKQADMLELASNIKEDRTSEDLLFQVMLDWGIELSLPIERKTIAGKEVFYVAGNSLVACFDNLTFDVVDEVAKDHPLRFVSAEKAIHLDHDKTNIKERFKQLSPDTEVKFL